MRRLILFCLALSLLSCTTPAKWTKTEIAMEAGVLALHAVDWAQTSKIANNPDKWHENNPILGKHPSQGRVNAVMGSFLVLQPLVAHLLPPNWRKGWIAGTGIVKLGCVANNLGVGVGWGF